MVHLPLVNNVKIPEHTMTVLGFLIEIAQFDVVGNDLVFGEAVAFPADQEELLRRPFVETGYESNYAFVNMGTNVIIIAVLLVFKVILLLFVPCRKQNNCVGRSHRKCSKVIFWNFWLRLVIQSCLEITIAACIYLIDREKYVEALSEEYSTFILFNDILSFSLLLILAVAPFWIIIFYCCRFKKFADKDFVSTYGSTISGLRTDRRSVIFQPVYFLLRRYAFFYIAIRWADNSSGQIHFLIMSNMIAALYILSFRPFNARLLHNLEVFNEVTSLILLYVTIGFLHKVYVDDDEQSHWYMLEDTARREGLGWGFMGIMGVNVGVHLFFLIRSTCLDC